MLFSLSTVIRRATFETLVVSLLEPGVLRWHAYIAAESLHAIAENKAVQTGMDKLHAVRLLLPLPVFWHWLLRLLEIHLYQLRNGGTDKYRLDVFGEDPDRFFTAIDRSYQLSVSMDFDHFFPSPDGMRFYYESNHQYPTLMYSGSFSRGR